jgi:outer membrane protein assembly factor BamD (BamD/ComL family)
MHFEFLRPWPTGLFMGVCSLVVISAGPNVWGWDGFSGIGSARGADQSSQPPVEGALSAGRDWEEKPSRMKDLITSITGRKAQPEKAKAEFAEAEAKFVKASELTDQERTKLFADAGELYTLSAKHWPGSVLAEDAWYMAGESFFFADMYPKAVRSYAGLIKQRPNSRYLDQTDERRFAIAKHWLQLAEAQGDSVVVPNLSDNQRPMTDTFGQAVALLDRIRFDNPAGKLADDATMAAAIAHFEKGHFAEADVLFTDLRENFASSEHQFKAHFLGLKCKQEIYEGVEYDGSALEEGERIIREIQRLFPEQAQEQYEYLANAMKDIRLKKAERDYALAQYYDNHDEARAARLYYDQVKREFSDTNLALESEGRIAELQGKPDAPDQSLEWLADMFPEEKPAKPLFGSDNLDKAKR